MARSDAPVNINNDAIAQHNDDAVHVIRHVSDHVGGHVVGAEGGGDARRFSLPLPSPRTGAPRRPSAVQAKLSFV